MEDNFKNIHIFLKDEFNNIINIMKNEFANFDNTREDLDNILDKLKIELHQNIFNKYNDSRIKFDIVLEISRYNFNLTFNPLNNISLLFLYNYDYKEIKDRKDLLDIIKKEILINNFTKEILDWK